MSPRPANPAVRSALIAAAARLLATEGPTALSSRRLAGEVGTSTMTIYTHFGSMSELHAAVRREGFARIASTLEARLGSDDPVADLAACCLAYLDAAIAEPELYRAMFNHRPPPGDDAGSGVFDLLVVRFRRCIEAGRFPDADPSRCPAWAGAVWTAVHGTATLALAGLIPDDQLRHLLADILYRLAVGFGDHRHAAQRSVDAALVSRRSVGWRGCVGSVFMSAPVPYLLLPGTAREALTFYGQVFGCSVELHTLEEFGRTDGPPDAIAHGVLVDGPVHLFAADATDEGSALRCEGMMLSLLGVASPDVLRTWFDALSETGRIVEPLEMRPWGATDGQVVDRYGLHWLIGFEQDTSQ